jgi:hypothetical protein
VVQRDGGGGSECRLEHGTKTRRAEREQMNLVQKFSADAYSRNSKPGLALLAQRGSLFLLSLFFFVRVLSFSKISLRFALSTHHYSDSVVHSCVQREKESQVRPTAIRRPNARSLSHSLVPGPPARLSARRRRNRPRPVRSSVPNARRCRQEILNCARVINRKIVEAHCTPLPAKEEIVIT